MLDFPNKLRHLPAVYLHWLWGGGDCFGQRFSFQKLFERIFGRSSLDPDFRRIRICRFRLELDLNFELGVGHGCSLLDGRILKIKSKTICDLHPACL